VRCSIKSNWVKIGSNAECIKNKKVKLNFSTRGKPEVLELSTPFKITDITAYMFGLALGSGVKRKYELTLKVDVNQLIIIKSFCNQFNMDVEFDSVRRARKKVGAEQPKKWLFKKYNVKIPRVVYKYMKCLGLDMFRPKIPNFFNEKQRKLLLSGYFNSKKTFLRHHSSTPINERIFIVANSNKSIRIDYAKSFAKEILTQLEDAGFNPKLKSERCRSEIIISRNEIPILVEQFKIVKPQIFYRCNLIRLCEQFPHLCRSLNIHKLNSFDLNILAITYHYFYNEKKSEIAFTKLEDELNITNNEIRKCLYELHKKGLIYYYKNNINKDYLRPAITGFIKIKNKFANQIQQLKKLLSQTGGLYFRCENCYQVYESLNLINENKNFECPNCNKSNFSEFPLEKLRNKYVRQMVLLNQYINSLESFPNF
ncbi:MAG: hypothetical protein ACTSO9_19355, partial [Candidatus Helarchaeota archaeon]